MRRLTAQGLPRAAWPAAASWQRTAVWRRGLDLCCRAHVALVLCCHAGRLRCAASVCAACLCCSACAALVQQPAVARLTQQCLAEGDDVAAHAVGREGEVAVAASMVRAATGASAAPPSPGPGFRAAGAANATRARTYATKLELIERPRCVRSQQASTRVRAGASHFEVVARGGIKPHLQHAASLAEVYLHAAAR